MISVCFLFFKIPLPRGGSCPPLSGAEHRAQSPLERWPRTISTDRPEMDPGPMNSFYTHRAPNWLSQARSTVTTPGSRALGPGRILGVASL